jgi:hypothetical protein
MDQLARRLEPSGISARDVQPMVHDPEFQAISDRNSQPLFLQQYAANECYVSLNHRKLAEIDQISEGQIRRLRCIARKKQQL